MEKEAANGVVVYTDGACSGNPGPGGWGAVILNGKEEIVCSGGESYTTNNRMELSAAIGVLEKISTLDALRTKKITVYIDSQYVKNGISSWILKWNACVSLLDIDWRWVKGHAGNTYNEMCDRLAVQESRKAAAL